MLGCALRERTSCSDPTTAALGTVTQEACHSRCHRQLNELLKANGYSALAEVEANLDQAYKRLEQRSLQTKLAFAAGFECMTNGFTHWFINRRSQLFGNGCPYVTSFWLMHVIEEMEHRTVAFDAYIAYAGQYLPRLVGVFHGSLHFFIHGLLGTVCALRQDGMVHQPRKLVRLVYEVGLVMWNVAPYLLRALLPGYNPRWEDNPQWFDDWIAGYSSLAPGSKLPLVDTSNPDMPVPFS